MNMRRIRSVIVLGLIGIGSLLAAYIWFLSPSERWLVLCAPDAEAYAERAFTGQTTDNTSLSSCMLDVVSSINPKERTALFSPQDNHEIAVIYAPGHSSKQLTYEQHVAQRIRTNWYALL